MGLSLLFAAYDELLHFLFIQGMKSGEDRQPPVIPMVNPYSLPDSEAANLPSKPASIANRCRDYDGEI
jgi:hypothetical protein